MDKNKNKKHNDFYSALFENLRDNRKMYEVSIFNIGEYAKKYDEENIEKAKKFLLKLKNKKNIKEEEILSEAGNMMFF